MGGLPGHPEHTLGSNTFRICEVHGAACVPELHGTWHQGLNSLQGLNQPSRTSMMAMHVAPHTSRMRRVLLPSVCSESWGPPACMGIACCDLAIGTER